jgi:hypothetical protein
MLDDYSNIDIIEYDNNIFPKIRNILKKENKKTSIELYKNTNNNIVISLNIYEDILQKINNNINVQFVLSCDFILDLLYSKIK